MSKEFETIIKVGMNTGEVEASSAEVSRKLKILDTGLREVNTQAKGFGETTDTLTRKEIILSDKVKLQTEQVTKLKDQLEKTREEKGENSKATDKITIRYNNAVAALTKYEGQLNDVQKELVKSEKNTKTLGDTVEATTKKISDGIEKAAKWGATLVAGTGAAAVALNKLALEAGETALEIDKYSQTVGMTTEAYQEWDYVMKTVGYSMEQASGDLANLGEKAMDAANGVGEGAEMFGKLGVDVEDSRGQLKSMEVIFQETIVALQDMENVTERNAIASALLSTTGEELASVLNMTEEEMANVKNQAQIIDQRDIDTAVEYKKQWEEVKAGFSVMATELGIAVMPALEEITDMVMDNLPEIQETIESVFDIIIPIFSVFGSVVGFIIGNFERLIPLMSIAFGIWAGVKGADAIGNIAEGFTDVVDVGQDAIKFFKTLNPTMLKTVGIVMLVVAGITALVVAISALTGKNKDIEQSMSSVSKSMRSMSDMSQYTVDLPQYATGTNYVTRDQVAVIHEGEAIVPKQDNPFNPNANTNPSWTNSDGGGDNIYITIDAKNVKEFNEMINMVKSLKQTRRAGA